MSTNAVPGNDPAAGHSIEIVDMKLEVVVIPVSDVDRAKEFYGSLGWRLDADFATATASGLSSSRRPARGARSISARISRPPRPARPRACTWSSPTSRRRARAVARGVDVSDVFHANAGTVHPTAPAASTDPAHQPATAPSPRSATRTATAGCCRRSRRGCPAASTPPRRRSRSASDLASAFGVRRPPTASTRSASAQPTRTGPTGTPRTWWRSRPGRSCRRERLRRHNHIGGGHRAKHSGRRSNIRY